MESRFHVSDEMRALPTLSNVPESTLILALQDAPVSSAQVKHQVLKVGKTVAWDRDLVLSLSKVATEHGLHPQLHLSRPQMVSLEGAFWSCVHAEQKQQPKPPCVPPGSHVLAELKHKIPQADKEIRRCPPCSWAAAGGDLSLLGRFQGKCGPLPSSPLGLILGRLSSFPAQNPIYRFQRPPSPQSSIPSISIITWPKKRDPCVHKTVYFLSDWYS